jgi:membrane protein implicated in regulation of membrane protease activity
MPEQNYNNHVRMHPLFHYIGAPLMIVAVIGTIALVVTNLSWVTLLAVVFSVVLAITFMLVRAYAAKLQDRVIRMEEQFRHYRLTGKPLPAQLTLEQVIALRFAADEEFPALCDKAVNDKLQPSDIKKAIANWRADHQRV